MKTAAFHTLGCKVNQYDTQAMLELFRQAGYDIVPFDGPADVYVLNTCTVTGTGDKKSLQLARRLHREHPHSHIVLCGCLAQRKGEKLLETGATLILGTQRRSQVVTLLEQAVNSGKPISAVEPITKQTPFESMTITDQEDHTRAILKIQEGCNNYCTYCIIPYVRGPIRSRPTADIRAEAQRLADAGFREVIVTGIHLTSYGRDLPDHPSLADALAQVHEVQGISRIRLGSLQPVIATPEFAERLKQMPKVCHQFHLALQSGSDTVLKRMNRHYTVDEFRQGAGNLRAAFPDCAITTDVIAGFPGETEQEFQQTADFIREIAFSRIHVFPYSLREGTKAAALPGHLTRQVKEERTRALISLGNVLSEAYRQSWIGREVMVIPEEQDAEGMWRGYTPEYISVSIPDYPGCRQGKPVIIRLTGLTDEGMNGEIV